MQDKIKQCLKNVAPVMPVIKVDKAEHILPIAEGLSGGGIRALEITLRTSAGFEAITLARKDFPDLVICAGTVTDATQVEMLVDAGIEFIVSPGITRSLLGACQKLGMPIVPGAATPSEVMLGMEFKLDLFKLFPANVVGGTRMLKDMAGPFPGIRFIPTGGLTPDNFTEYLALPNVFCVGGSWLVAYTDGEPDTGAIEKIARDTLRTMSQVKR